MGWHGGQDFVCEQCRRDDCDGGYAEYMIAPTAALVAIPDKLPAEEAGPFMCAGVTVFNALRNSGARAGDVVAGKASAAWDISASGVVEGLAAWQSIDPGRA